MLMGHAENYLRAVNVKCLKGRVYCFSTQDVMNKCFLLNPEKNLAQIRLAVFEKNVKKHTFNSEK